MKKIFLVLLLGALVAIPVLANATLINLGYNVLRYSEDYSERGIGPVFTFLAGQQSGFYAQLAPFYSTSWKWFDTVVKYGDNPDLYGGGLSFTLGYGRDFNFGEMGVLVGGGLFVLGFAWVDTYWEDFGADLGFGPGGGAHFYFKPGEGRLILNAGLDVAWRPVYAWGSDDAGYGGFEFEKGNSNVNLNAGIGFRR